MAIIEKGKQLETAIKITAEATGKDLLEDDVSTDTNLPEQLRAAALAENVKKLHDKDLDSVCSAKKVHNRPFKVAINDDGSTTSSLTNNTLHSKESTLSEITNNTANTNEDVSLASARSKYTISEEVIANIAKSELKENLTAERLESLVLRFQEHKMATAITQARLQIAQYIETNNVPASAAKGNVVEESQLEEDTSTNLPTKKL